MTATRTLGSREFETALAVLKREQAENMPSSRQLLFYRLFNWSVLPFLAVGILYLLSLAAADMGDDWEVIFLETWGVVSLIVIVLFVANIGLIRKLRRQAQLRRRLQLTEQLRLACKASG